MNSLIVKSIEQGIGASSDNLFIPSTLPRFPTLLSAGDGKIRNEEER